MGDGSTWFKLETYCESPLIDEDFLFADVYIFLSIHSSL